MGLALRVEGLWFRYPGGPWVLRGASMALGEGEIALIAGGSGSGKTTLARAITGSGVEVYGGEMRGVVEVGGVNPLAHRGRISELVQVVSQNPWAHFAEHVVGEDLLAYAEELYGPSEGSRRLEEALELVGAESLVDKLVSELSGGQLRRAAIAKALLSDPELLILDEPMMWLDEEGEAQVIEVVERLKASGRSVLILEHRYAPLMRIVDRSYAMEGGRIEEFEPRVPAARARGPRERRGPGEVVLRARGLRFRYSRRGPWVLEGVDLDVEMGELVAVYGRNGSGKSTLLKLLAGYLKPTSGSVERRGRAFYVPQIPYLLFSEETVEGEIEALCPPRSECAERGAELARTLAGLDGLDSSPFSLSWGQQVRLAVALALASRASILLMDEPFSGLPYSDRLELSSILRSAPAAKIVSAASRESLEILEPDRALELSGGRLREVDLA
ncbi:MAG: ATP-binding cassette domain-containing protein [Fervidicoccaceae archaeon]